MKLLEQTSLYGLLLLVIWGLSSCSGPSTEEYVTALEKMAQVVDQHSMNCERMGVALSEFANGPGKTIRNYHKYQKHIVSSKREKAESAYKKRIQTAMKLLKPSHTECATNKRVIAAFEML